MEARRQAVLQKKVEEGKVKAGEEERRVKEDTERRKKEREENTSKRPLVRTDSKVCSSYLQRSNANPRFVIACRRGQYEEKQDDRRGSESQTAFEGEKGCTPNSYRKTRSGYKFENNDHDEEAVYYIVKPNYKGQSSTSGEARHQTCSYSCLSKRQRQNDSRA